MATLRRIPPLVTVLIVLAALLAALSIGAAQWLEAAENLRVAEGGDPDPNVGIGYALLAGFVPVMLLLGSGIASGILLAKRTRARQDAGLTPAGWGNRAGMSLAMLVLLLALGSVVVLLVWFGIRVLLIEHYGEIIVSQAGMAGNLPVVLGLVFGPGMTGGLPAILMTASAPTPEEENA